MKVLLKVIKHGLSNTFENFIKTEVLLTLPKIVLIYFANWNIVEKYFRINCL